VRGYRAEGTNELAQKTFALVAERPDSSLSSSP
jgi:hypothetical protein